MEPTHFSFRKLRRKLNRDGSKRTIIDSIETAYRRIFYTYIFQFLSKTGRIQILETQDLEKKADRGLCLNLGDRGLVYELASGNVFSDTGLVITDDAKVITQSAGSPEFSKQFTIESLAHQDFARPAVTPHFLLSSIKNLPATRINKNISPLIPRYNNYYHWMVGTVPKIRYVEKYQEKTGESVTFLLPHNPSQWVKQTLSLLGCTSEQFLVAQEPIYKPHRTVVPPHPFPGQEDDYRWIRHRVFENLKTENYQGPSEKVYISRENAIGRRVVNKNSLMEMLSDHGFKKYHLEDRTVAENIRLFSNADMVVSPHGAGLTDIMFCDDCTVVELFGSRENNAYELLCNDLDLDYVGIKCEPVSTDIYADINRIEQVIVSRGQNA